MANRFRSRASSAASNRFARPQSSQSSPAPLSSSRLGSSRFVRSTSSQQPGFTPKRTIPQIQRDNLEAVDQIENSFEEPDLASSPLPSRARFSSSLPQSRGAVEEVEDVDDEEAASPRTNLRRTTDQGDLTINLGEDVLADLEFLERLRGTLSWQDPADGDQQTTFFSNDDEDEDLQGQNDDLFKKVTTTAARKRRRLDDRIDHDSNRAKQAEWRGHRPIGTTTQGSDTESDSDSTTNLSSSPLTGPTSTSTNNNKNKTPSRFKKPPSTPFLQSSTHKQPQTQTQTQAHHRPTFRDPSANPSSPTRRHHHHHHSTNPTTTYLPGGAADTVRSWILGLIGTDKQHHESNDTGHVDFVNIVHVARVLGRDAGGRCIMVRDRAGQKWVFIGGEREIERGFIMDHDSEGYRAQVVVGVRMGWDVDLGGNGDDGREVWKVAVMWDVLDQSCA
jgi:hypothetical protein